MTDTTGGIHVPAKADHPFLDAAFLILLLLVFACLIGPMIAVMLHPDTPSQGT